MKEKLLDKDTIDAYHTYVQSQIRTDLNAISLGPGRLPTRVAQGLLGFGFCCLLVGILLIALRMQHVYFWDWDVQFVGPFFVIMFLACLGGATYMILVASRRSNRFRRELYFHPLGDYSIAAVHKDDLVHQQDLKHDLRSGTTPHKNIMPRSDAYSQMNLHKAGAEKEGRRQGHHNQAYRHGPGDQGRRPTDHRRSPPGPDDRRRGPPPDGRGRPPDGHRRHYDDRRGGPPRSGPRPEGDFRQGPPEDRRRGPDDRRGPPPEGRRGPPPDGYRRDDDRRRPPDDRDRRGPPPGDRRGPPPDDRDRRGPPPDDRDRRGPPPDDRDRRGPPPDDRDRRGPPPERRGSPPGDRRGPPPDDRRPRGPPTFRAPDDEPRKIKLQDGNESESEL